MSVTQLAADGLVSKYEIKIAAEEYNSIESDLIKEMQQQAKIPGFRPGKVPASVIRSRFGDNLKSDVLNKLIPSQIESVIKEYQLDPAIQPKIEDTQFDDVEQLSFKLEIETTPNLPQVKLDELTLKRLKLALSEDDIAESMLNFQKKYIKYEDAPADATAKTDDRVSIDFEGTIDGEPFDGNKAAAFPVVIGSNGLIPGFEDQLIGAKLGDEKTLDVTFPVDYQAKNLAGKPAKFDIKVIKIEHSSLPELNEELFEKFHVKTKEEFTEVAKETLDTFFNQQNHLLQKKALFDELDKLIDVDVPPTLLDEQYQQLLAAEAREQQQEADKLSTEQTAELQQLACRRIKLGIWLSKYAEGNNISVSQDEFNSVLKHQLAQYGNPEQMMNFYRQNPSLVDNLRGEILENKAIDHIFGQLSYQDEEINFADFRKLLDESEW